MWSRPSKIRKEAQQLAYCCSNTLYEIVLGLRCAASRPCKVSEQLKAIPEALSTVVSPGC